MDNINYDFVETPILVTLRDLEPLSMEMRKAMKHYDTTIATKVFKNAMVDAPRLFEDLRNLRNKHQILFAEHEKLKKEIAIFFETQSKFLKMTETNDQKQIVKNNIKAEKAIKDIVKSK